MGADFSRIRSNPLLDVAGVELKQGGVVLDADFNELVAVVDRRLRAAASDILGRGTVSSTTPDAFKITAIPGGLQIGKGRFYVDGLLAENHGAVSSVPAKKHFDPLMAEANYADPIAYSDQPYLPSPLVPPTADRHLVYLDVWERELTHLECPELVEPAVGVETSSRLQTVWQVRVLEPDAGSADCSSPDGEVKGWAALTAPSTGRLTTGTFEVPPETDPCELPPSGGYRGLENQTYRVEIHDPGQPDDKATFKWSRENASVGSRVASMISETELELQTLGRDDVLRFNTGDWVEVIDDVRELSQGTGVIRRITVIEAARRITFASPLPTEMLPAPPTFPNSEFPRTGNLRVRRWDQKGKVLRTGAGGSTLPIEDLNAVGSTGVIKVPAAGTTLLLENGVTVNFPSTGTTRFRAGDYWVFAARTANASVELLTNEPPRGIHHHYARLGIWDLATRTVTDCRTPWPPHGEGHDCSCTICVTPQSHASNELTIQMAIDEVKKAGGGTVCLDVGRYELSEPVTIKDARSVKLVGKGIDSKLLAIRATGAVLVINSHDIVLDSFSVLCSGSSAAPEGAVGVVDSGGIRVEHLAILVKSENSQDAAIGLANALMDISLRGNALVAPIGIHSGSTRSGGGDAVLADVRIEDNDFDCGTAAIAFAPVTVHQLVNRICGNRVNGCKETAFLLTGMTAPGFFGLEVRANVFSVLGDGIVASLSGLRVLDNDVLQAREAPLKQQCGIILAPAARNLTTTDCQIIGNRIQGFNGAGILVKAPLRTAMIKQNQIAQVNVGLALVSGGELVQLSIENNQFNDITDSAILGTGKAARYAATGNQIHTHGREPAVQLEFKSGEGVFSHNQCYRDGGGDAPDVRLRSDTLIVGNNRVVGVRGGTSLHIGAAERRITVLGNICHGKIKVNSADLALPWAPLNIQDVP
jgi:hypothetical protein